MRETIRPAGSGRDATAHAFLRSSASPRAALVLASDAPMPGDWPAVPTSGNAEDGLGHGLGWTLEIQRTSIVLLNPLGEGQVKASLPDLAAGWLQAVREEASCAVFLVPSQPPDTSALLAIDTAGRGGSGRAASVRSAFSDDFGKVDPVGRNAPCPCGSGKKHKHCCG